MIKPGTAARDRERFDPEDSPLTAKIRIEYERIIFGRGCHDLSCHDLSCHDLTASPAGPKAESTTVIEIETIE